MHKPLPLRTWVWVILTLGAVTFALRADSFFHPQILPQDEAAYYRVAKQWLEGTPIYAGDFDHKPPGIHYIFATAMAMGRHTMLPIRWAAVLFSWLAAVALFGMARRVWLLYGVGEALPQAGAAAPSGTAAQVAGWVAGLLYAACSTRMGGYTANTELFFNPFVVLCLWGVVEAAARPRLPAWLLLFAGMAGGYACLIKYPVAAESALAAGLWLMWMRGGRTWAGMLSGRALSGLAILTLGYLVPLAACAAHFAAGGRLDILIQQSILANLSHRGATRHKTVAYVFYYTRTLAEFAPALAGLLWLPFARRALGRSIQVLMGGWLTGAMVSATLTGHPYLHYILEVLPVLCLATGWLAAFLAERFVASAREAVTASGLLLPARPWALGVWLILLPTVPAFFAAGEANLSTLLGDYLAWRRTGDLWAPDPAYQVALYMKNHLAPGQIWFGIEASPVQYDLSEHPLPTHYSFWPFLISEHFEHVTGVNQMRELGRLFALKPTYLATPTLDFDAYSREHKVSERHRVFFDKVFRQYRLVEKVGPTYILERAPL